MTRKDYITIAAIISDARLNANGLINRNARLASQFSIARIRNDLAHMFAADNPRFDRSKFMAACEVQS